ncbi:MAG: Rid family hydrolase [Sedimentisphaerales bacterium]
MQLVSKTIRAGSVAELYITACPNPDADTEKQAEELFTAVKTTLEDVGAQLVQERVFATEDALRLARPIRSSVYAELDDGVEPAWLVTPEGINGRIAGLQVHAVTGCPKPQVLRYKGTSCGRLVQGPDTNIVMLSGICNPAGGDAVQQACDMLEKGLSVLKQVGLDMFAVPRTWMWLGNILHWYDQFNNVRNAFFTKWGLIGNGQDKMPASTGIGIRPANGSLCAMDLAAVSGKKAVIKYINIGGNQMGAINYGSAFSRATVANTIAGETVFVSGTASIGADGKTTNIGDTPAQIRQTIENVRALLRQLDCCNEDVVQATAYCKTPEIEKLFCEEWSALPWPVLTAIADICREDLLFEMEATAVRPYR